MSSSYQEWYSTMLYDIDGYLGQDQHDKVALFQQTLDIDVSGELPLLYVKPTPWLLAIAELLWFMSDSNKVADLEAAGVKWWRPWFGDKTELSAAELPYKRHAAGYKRVAQALLDGDYDSTRLFVNLWPHDEDLALAVLPPCALSYQVVIHGDRLHMTVTQRSADLVCGVPSNVIQYSFLMHLYASIAGLKPGNLQMNFGNLHVYKSHLKQPEWKELLARAEYSAEYYTESVWSTAPIAFSCLKSVVPIGFMYEPDAAHAKCFTLANYEPQPGLKFPVVTTPGQYKA